MPTETQFMELLPQPCGCYAKWLIELKSHLGIYYYALFTCAITQEFKTFNMCRRIIDTHPSDIVLPFSYILPCNLEIVSVTNLKLYYI